MLSTGFMDNSTPEKSFRVDTIAPMSYVALNTLFDAAFPYGGVQRYWKSSFLRELGDDVLDIMIARSAKFLSPMSNVLFFHLHGVATRVDRDSTAFGLRDGQGPGSPLADYDGAYRFPVNGANYHADLAWLDVNASFNPEFAAGRWGASAFVVGSPLYFCSFARSMMV